MDRGLMGRDKVVPHIENEHDELIVALVLLDYALTLRTHGECAPGGTETWRAWDASTEAFLRRMS